MPLRKDMPAPVRARLLADLVQVRGLLSKPARRFVMFKGAWKGR
jgi:hypothetical protein